MDLGSESATISSTFSEQVMVDSANYTWKKLDLPKEDVIMLDQHRPRRILDASTLEMADPSVLSKAFSVVLHDPTPGGSTLVHGREFLTNKW